MSGASVPRSVAVEADDDVIDFFDPWSVEIRGRLDPVSGAGAPATPPPGGRAHWSAREARSGPPFPNPVVSTPPSKRPGVNGPDAFATQVSTPGPAGFLRNVLLPEVQAVAARLEGAKHRTALQDLLDLPEPAFRMLVWPSPGLMGPAGPGLVATIEFVLEQADPASVAIRHWFGPGGGDPVSQARIPFDEIDPIRLRAEILDFLKKVLDRA